ncbi:MAG: EscU/YscU/HrcU family type III secretion system export apparatus switch protein [Hyphomonas sp.]
MAEEQGDSGEKEFEASQQKQDQARKDGNIPQSKETSNLATVLGVIIAAVVFQAVLGNLLFSKFSSLLLNAEDYAHDSFFAGGGQMNRWLQGVLMSLAPLFGILAVMAILMLVITQSIAISAKKIKPEMKKISPIENIKKKYGSSGLIDFSKDTAKMLFAGVIASVFLLQFAREYYASSAIQTGQIFQFTFEQVLRLIGAFAIFQFCLAAIDFPIQRRLHANRLKMTREELKKEVKQSEGDQHVKQSRRQRGAEIASGKMMQNVKESTVIMVNPEHYAVALKWDPNSQQAPIVMAKGVDHIAATIREIAKENNIPIYRDPPSTRSIYRLVDVDEEIHPEHFAAVAAAIQYVDRVSKSLDF